MDAFQAVRPVFCYAYRPLFRANSAEDGGFTVNLMDNGLLVYDVFDPNQQVVFERSFEIPAYEVEAYIQEVYRAKWWLDQFPLHMSEGAQPAFTSMVGLNGYPQMFRMDDLYSLSVSPFGSMRGHYARLMFNLLEEVTGMLRTHGVQLDLNRFGWDPAVITPMEERRRHRLFG